ncbi:MAG: tetratricopeptide repeat protein [Candidatus Heimdallarchaeota archaeon]|nr:tetratricopeptide repeat protein [Candidatus Heimdallarchaeota archaeon]
MPSIPKSKFKDIEQLIIQGDFKEAQDSLVKLEKIKEICKEDKLTCWLYQAEIYNHMGDYKKALDRIESILKIIKKKELQLINLDTLLQQAITFWRIGQLEESIVLNEKCGHLLPSFHKLPAKALAKRNTIHLMNLGIIPYIRGEYDEAIEYFQQAYLSAQKSENNQLLCYILTTIGIIYQFGNNFEEAEEHYNQALVLAEEISNKQEIARIYHWFGVLYRSSKYDYTQSLEFFEKSISFVEASGSQRDLKWIYGDFGLFYQNIFELDKALEFYLKAENSRKEDAFSQVLLNAIGYIYHLKNEFDQAIKYYKKSLKICKEIGDKRRMLPLLLFNLITASIENNELQQAQKYVDYFHQISIEVNDAHVNYFYKLASALMLKTDTRIRKWIEAEQLLEQLLEEEELTPDLTIIALLNLAELLLRELQHSENKEILLEIEKNITKLYNKAEKGHFYGLLINTLRLQSQIALVELNLQKALQLLSQALIISKDKGLEKHTEEITVEKQKLIDQIAKWEGFQEKKAPISETLKHVKLENGIKRISKETVLEVKDEETGKVIEYRKLFALKI